MATKSSNDGLAPPPTEGAQTPTTVAPSPVILSADAEKQSVPKERPEKRVSAFKSLGWLDRFLAVWILLAMVLGVLLGNFVPETGPALQKGKFVEVSVPIGRSPGKPFPGPWYLLSSNYVHVTDRTSSRWITCHDVSYPLQGPVRDSAHCL